ncbi:MAG: asparaginase [Burkholderiaceae bacterium]|jgi:L-asparaginase II|nr:asparaginase [Burkholderiaceae bacterium]
MTASSLRPPRHVPLVTTTRGNLPELVHYGSIAVVDAHGTLVAGVGDAHGLNYTRSALKPLQALAFVEDGGAERFAFGSHELALMCASHNGEAIHVATAQRMLDRIDARESDLQCGCHVPSYFSHNKTEPPAGARWSPLFHNCSGKHSGFLAYCRLHGKPLKTYLDPDAPLQQRVRATVQRFAHKRELPMGIDGCSAPNFAMPLSALAHAFCQLSIGATPALAALRYAMARHPDLVSGTGRSDLALMRAGRCANTGDDGLDGDWVTKIGADGVQAIGIASRGLGIAIRVADGNTRALLAATVEVLRQLKQIDDPATTPLARYARPKVTNYRGTVVGEVVPLFTLPRVFV